MRKTVPEPEAELLSAEDVLQDAASLTSALERRRSERRAYAVLERPQVQEMLNRLIGTGLYSSEEEVIENALRTLLATAAR